MFSNAKTGDCIRFLTMAMQDTTIEYIKHFDQYNLIRNGMGYYNVIQYCKKYGNNLVKQMLVHNKITRIAHIEIICNLMKKFGKCIVFKALESNKLQNVFDVESFVVKNINNKTILNKYE